MGKQGAPIGWYENRASYQCSSAARGWGVKVLEFGTSTEPTVAVWYFPAAGELVAEESQLVQIIAGVSPPEVMGDRAVEGFDTLWVAGALVLADRLRAAFPELAADPDEVVADAIARRVQELGGYIT